MTRAIVWFRRDLRLSDNRVLRQALEDADEIVPLFVLDDRLWEASGPNRRWFLHGCLTALDDSLDGRLVIRRGSPATVIRSLAADIDADAVYRAEDVGVYGRERDEAVAGALERDGREVIVADSPFAIPVDTIHTGSGSTYKVYTPFYRAWKDRGVDDPVQAPSDIAVVDGVDGDDLPDRDEVTADLPEPGEEAAKEAARRFYDTDLADYDDVRDDAAADRTSRLSPYLKFGCIHPRQLMAKLDLRKTGHETFAGELAWRDFYADVLNDRPSSGWAAWSDKLADIELDTGDDADDKFARWCEGRTGYPLVDAGMRQLLAEGWMHNRIRMVVASFLVKDLHIDWTRGAKHFLHHLVDGDLSSNNHGWQWAAGTGTDAAPYFRIFNPVSQSEKHDPDGTYIRRWVPELSDVAADAIHEPWEHDLDVDYPDPIVDHAEEREEALRRYDAVK